MEHMMPERSSDDLRPAEGEKPTRSTRNFRKTVRTTHERRETATERYEKTTRRSKTRRSETTEVHERPAAIRAEIPGEADSAARLGDPKRARGAWAPAETDPSPRRSPAPPTKSDWHVQMPESVRVSVDGATPSDFDGDYVLSLVERGVERCRWELAFPTRNGLHRALLEATRRGAGPLALRGWFDGLRGGPKWDASKIGEFRAPVELRLDGPSRSHWLAGEEWPETVTVTPLQEPLSRRSFYISTEPTSAEIMQAEGSSGSSGSEDKCQPSEQRYFYSGAEKRDLVDVIGASGKITTNETVLDCEPDGTYKDHSAVWISAALREAEFWAQTGYSRFRAGSARIQKKRYSEVVSGPGAENYYRRFADCPSATAAHNYVCMLDVPNGEWTFRFDGVLWDRHQSDNWNGRTCDNVQYYGEIYHKKTQMVGIPDAKCRLSNCAYRVWENTVVPARFVDGDLATEGGGDYIADEWGRELADGEGQPTQGPTDHVNIWDKKPPFSEDA